MATIEEYVSGKAAMAVKMGNDALASIDGDVTASEKGKRIIQNVNACEPLKLTMEQAMAIINQASICAVGERVCRAVYKTSPETQTVFLDELALSLVQANSAREVSHQEAVETLQQQTGHPIMASKVSGKYMEICRSIPKDCIYWNLARHGCRCFGRPGK